MSLKLHVVKGKEPGQVIVVPDDAKVVIGRKNADVCLDDQLLSRQHMKVELRAGQALIADMGSSNGTFLNGDKISESRLAHGDKIKIGGHILHVEIASGAAGAAGAQAAAQAGVQAILDAPLARRETVFCARSGRAIPIDEARNVGGLPVSEDCVEGAPLPEGIIEGFKIVARIADGRLGPIYKARHLALMKYVTLRVLRSDFATDERRLKRFAREAKIGGRLHHPSIVELYDAAQSHGHYYMTLELVDGETLEERMLTARPDSKETLRIGARIADALRYAFDSFKVVHRNVKPSNIFLSKKGEVKLGDFGLCRSLDPAENVGEATGTGEVWGTLPYLAPEQLEDARSADQRADIYGLGATLYHAITGARPFEAASLPEMFERIRTGTLDPAEKVAGKACPRALSQVIARCMERDKARRFQSAGELLQALTALGA